MTKKYFLRIMAFTTALMLLLSLSVSALAYSTIDYGTKGDNVRKMQLALKEQKYYTGTVDGKFGPATKTAVIKFQNAMGLTADGKPGNKTLSALYDGTTAVNATRDKEAWTKLPSDPDTLYYGQTGSRIKELQRSLKAAGFYKGTIDGVYGDLTLKAVKSFQSKYGLKTDGLVGSKTLSKLNEKSSKKVSTSLLLDLGSRGAQVRKIQNYLINAGYTVEDTLTIYGQSTSDAVKAWQTDKGRSATGTFSEDDYNAMFIVTTK